MFVFFIFWIEFDSANYGSSLYPKPQPSQKKPFYKIKDLGPAWIDIPFKQLHYQVRDQVPQY